jgi:hypothetical protein
MTYTRSWDETSPVEGADLAEDLNDAIRNLKADIRERMNAIPNVIWTADPVYTAPAPVVTTPDDFYQSWHGGQVSVVSGAGVPAASTNREYLCASATSTVLLCVQAIPCPIGSLISLVTWYADRHVVGAAIDFELWRLTLSTGSPAQFISASASVGYGTVASTAGALTVATADQMFYAVTKLTNGASVATDARYYGLKVTYS